MKPPAAPDAAVGALFLMRGNSPAYRGLFAMPEAIGNVDGQPTNAIYRVAWMMVKLLIDHHPGAVIVAWDAGMSGREKQDRKSTRLNSSHGSISYAVFCLKKK